MEPDREVTAAGMLNALGNETRLRIFRALVRAGTAGLNVGDVQRRVAVPASTCAHHLATLRHAGLVAHERKGREVVCVANYGAMDGLVTYLTAECCADENSDLVNPESAARRPHAHKRSANARVGKE